MSRFLLQMAGMTGTGKTTLAAAIGCETGAVVIDKDLIMAGAMRTDIDSATVGALAYEVGLALAESILTSGHDVILDSPANFTMIRDKGAEVARRANARYYIIQCLVPELSTAEKRIAGRTPLHSLHPTSFEGLDMDHSRPGTSPLIEPHLDIDTARPPDICLREALRYIGHDQD